MFNVNWLTVEHDKTNSSNKMQKSLNVVQIIITDPSAERQTVMRENLPHRYG